MRPTGFPRPVTTSVSVPPTVSFATAPRFPAPPFVKYESKIVPSDATAMPMRRFVTSRFGIKLAVPSVFAMTTSPAVP